MRKFLSCTFVLSLFFSCFEVSANVKKLWIEKAQGIQCERVNFNTIYEAIRELQSNNIRVFNQGEESYIVIAVCGAETSLHFQAEILESDLEKAKLLNWYEIRKK